MTLPYSKTDPQPAALDANETAFTHEGTGNLIAVSIVPTWMTNGVGMCFMGKARWIDADGSTHTCPMGQQVTTSFCPTFDHGSLDALTMPVIAREMTLALLGCDLTLHNVDGEQVPLIPWATESLPTLSILKAIETASASGDDAINVGDVLLG